MARGTYYRTNDGVIECDLCPHHCRIEEGETGVCLGRRNRAGRLVLENYGEVTSLAMDPIEKKPLFHFYPGEQILSLGTFGCNFSCPFCQNWRIATRRAESRKISAGDVVRLAVERNSIGIAYTYNEPLIWYEYVFKTARLAREEGLKNVLVTNGYLNKEPLVELLKYIDAVNLDLKAFNTEFYREFTGGDLEVIKRNAKIFREFCHLELTTLLITDLNDRPEEIKVMARWIREELGPEVPLHLTRYFPNYQLDRPETPIKHMEQAREAAEEFLYYVYLGNIGREMDTQCYKCGYTVIERDWYGIDIHLDRENRCPECGAQIHLVR